MKTIFLSALILLISVSGFAQEVLWSPTIENTKIVSEQEFFTLFEPKMRWKHIIRLKKENPTVIFEDLQNEDDFTSIKIPANSPMAYKLYSGDFVVFSNRPVTQTKEVL